MTNRYRQLLLSLSATLIFGQLGAIAEPEVSPLENPLADPLVPTAVAEENRDFSPLETGRIRRTAEDLKLSGYVNWQSQLPEPAFADWMRHLLLLQLLPDRQAEIESLGEIGAIAWENNRIEDSRAITKRLDVIRAEEYPTDASLLIPLAEAYQQLRNSGAAIALYRTHLETLEEPYQADILRLIAQLAAQWFDYEEALAAYGEIEALNALTISDREHFSALYETINLPTEALRVQRQLPPLYLQELNYQKLADIYLKIAINAHRISDYELAIDSNEFAFALAWELKYLEIAEDALNQLARVYLAQDNEPFAMQVYEQLLIVQNESYNRFGMMETYAALGELYESSGLYPSALISWQQGLAIAKELNHNIETFTAAIETLPRQ